MTVCVAVKVHDCMVFAADSATTLTSALPDGTRSVVKVYDHADKVFNLRRDRPIVAMTCGMGHIGDRSIGSLAKQLRYDLTLGPDPLNPTDYTIKSVVDRAHQFFTERYAEANPVANASDYLEFWIGGYGSSNAAGEAWKVVISAGVVLDPQPVFGSGQAQGLAWGGQGEAIARLVLGVDHSLVPVLVGAGVTQANAEAILRMALGGLERAFIHATMPTTDAIRVVNFLVDLTKGYFSFVPGSNIVGGATDLATVTKWEGFKWVQRKHFYPSGLNNGDHDHVC